jgi:hypothetical protein
VQGQALLLHELVSNLVDNAIRYTPPGGIVLLRVRRLIGRQVLLEVQDSGPGRASDRSRLEHRDDKVFMPFYRAAGGAGDESRRHRPLGWRSCATSQVDLGRRDYTHVHRHRVVGTEPLDVALLQHAQQFDLQRQRQAFDLVEEQRTLVGMLDLADLALGRARERAGLVAEHFALEDVFRDRPAIQGDEVVRTAAAELVQAARHHFLAGARFAVDQHVGGFVGQVEDQAAQVAHRGRIAQQHRLDAVAVRDAVAQRLDLQDQAPRLQRALHRLDQLLRRIRLGDEIVGAAAHRAHGHRNVAVARHQDHRHLRIDGLDGGHQVDAAHAGQAHVADDDAGETGFDLRQRRLGGVEGVDLETGEIKRLRAARADDGVVFDEQHFHGFIRSHGRYPTPRGADR